MIIQVNFLGGQFWASE